MMMTRLFNTRRWVVALVLLGTPGWAADKDLYVNPRPFGPEQVAFPANCAIDSEGRWVAFMLGAESAIAIWNLESAEKVWSGKYPCGSHRVAFAWRESDRVACITEKGLVVVRHLEDAWSEERVTPLGLKPEIDKRTSPSPISPNYDGSSVLFVEAGKSYCVKKGEPPPEPLDEDRGETSYHTIDLAFTGTAFAKRKPFKTRILSDRGQDVVKGVVLAGSANGALLLVATNNKFDSGRARLQIIDRSKGKRVGAFTVSRGLHRAVLDACFSPDSTLLVTVEGKGPVVIRDARTGKVRQKITAYETGYAVSAAFDPETDRLITCGMRKDAPGTLIWDRK